VVLSIPFLSVFSDDFSAVISGTLGHHSQVSEFLLSPQASRRRTTRDEKNFLSGKKLQQRCVSRRNLIRGAAGTAAGAGFLLGSGLRMPALAQEAAQETCRDLPRPIPHITGPGHFFFPGPPDGSAPMTFPHFPNAGFDPSTITDFQGMIAQADLNFGGTGADLNTGDITPYTFHTDWRFMTGVFIGVDGLQHNGTLSFI